MPKSFRAKLQNLFLLMIYFRISLQRYHIFWNSPPSFQPEAKSHVSVQHLIAKILPLKAASAPQQTAFNWSLWCHFLSYRKAGAILSGQVVHPSSTKHLISGIWGFKVIPALWDSHTQAKMFFWNMEWWNENTQGLSLKSSNLNSLKTLCLAYPTSCPQSSEVFRE